VVERLSSLGAGDEPCGLYYILSADVSIEADFEPVVKRKEMSMK